MDGEVRLFIGDAVPALNMGGLVLDRSWGDPRALIGVRDCGAICIWSLCCVYGVKLFDGFGTALAGVDNTFGCNAAEI